MPGVSRRSWLLLALLLPAAAGSFAQAYPAKPIRLVVPFPAGGAVDSLARIVTPKMAEALGQPILVDNRAGAGGNIGADAVAKAPPDGYTALLNTNGHAISPALYRKLPFDAEKDFIPVSQLVASTLILVAYPKLPAASVKEFIALARSRPARLNYGSTGVGNPLHLTMELLKISAGIDVVAVPYKGDAPLNTALMAGEVEVAIVPLSTSLQFIRSGRLRALGVTAARRLPALPDVPTVAEDALPGFESSSWQGVFLPAKTPREAVAALHRSIAKALQAGDVRERIQSMGQEIVGSTPEEFSAKVKADMAKFAGIVKQARIPLQD